jgi:hypothetical protein
MDKQEQTPWLLIRKQNIPTERPPLVGEITAHFAGRSVAWSAQWVPTAVNLGFLDRSGYFLNQVAAQITSLD